jgi:exodeoxyribonuclease-3
VGTVVKIATWNINSVRLRLPLVLNFLRRHQPDVICLQETKVINDLFPADSLRRAGYLHQAIHGQKGYHGVAILSRLPFKRTERFTFCGKEDCRHISATLGNGLELHNFYVPAGGDIPDAKHNAKFAHKLEFLREMTRAFARRQGNGAPVVLTGDLNVAPLENDVWSHKQLLGVVSHTPVETALLRDAQSAFDWIDVTRSFVPPQQKVYSWWSYRARDWKTSDRGRRLDHIWINRPLKDCLIDHAILKPARGWRKASDHVPVMATLSL